MTNLTISIDENIVKKARVRAINEGTSVSAQVRVFLADYAQGNDRRQAAGLAFVAAARRSKANRTRDDAHDRPYP